MNVARQKYPLRSIVNATTLSSAAFAKNVTFVNFVLGKPFKFKPIK